MMNKYTAQVTRETPVFILFLIDNSSSMEEKVMYEGVLAPKSVVVSRLVNFTFNEIINQSKRYDGHKDYFNLMALGYADDKVENLLENRVKTSDKSYCSVTDLVSASVPFVTYESVRTTAEGTKYVSTLKTKEFIRCSAKGNTPMGKALETACNYVDEWVKTMKNRTVFPPIVINITDGECTDCSAEELKQICERLKSLRTADGEVLLMNIHIASSGEVKSALFPCDLSEIDCVGRYAELMFECSSELPDRFAPEVANLRGDDSSAGVYRAFAYNSSMNELLRMLNIGSISVVK